MLVSKDTVWYKKYDLEVKKRVQLEQKLEKYEERYTVLEQETGRMLEFASSPRNADSEFGSRIRKFSLQNYQDDVKEEGGEVEIQEFLNYDESKEENLDGEGKEGEEGDDDKSKVDKSKRLQNIRRTKLNLPDLNIDAITQRIAHKVESATLPITKREHSFDVSKFIQTTPFKNEALSNQASPTFRSKTRMVNLEGNDLELEESVLDFEVSEKKCVLCSRNLHPVYEDLHTLQFEYETLR